MTEADSTAFIRSEPVQAPVPRPPFLERRNTIITSAVVAGVIVVCGIFGGGVLVGASVATAAQTGSHQVQQFDFPGGRQSGTQQNGLPRGGTP